MRKIVIIDDFYSNPEQIRLQALSTDYISKSTGSYPGQNSVDPFLPTGLDAFIIGKLGEHVAPANKTGHGHFRLHHMNDTFKQWIHSDPVDWGGVLYLNHGSQGGTAFWKHKATSLQHFPNSVQLQDMGLTKAQAHTKFNETDGQNEENWELEFLCPAKFNRLVLFPSQYWHSHMPKEGFGQNNNDARLIQLFFFSKV